ncbi:MAG: FAD-binding oxidoreductase [Nanoarchaeota archaeon]
MDENRVKMKISEIRNDTNKVKTFKFVPVKGNIFEFLPGQFVMLYAGINDEEVGRAYSIASSPLDKHFLELTLELTPDGKLTTFFHKKAKVGDEFEISQPKGHFTYTEESGKDIVLIAGGSGVVPMRCMIKYCTQKNLDTKIILVYSAKTQNDLIYRDELVKLAEKNSNLEIIYTLTRETGDWQGRKGRVDKELLSDIFSQDKVFYLCGPIPFIRELGTILKELGADRKNIKRDVWGA